MEGHLSVEEFMSILAHQKWTRYFENSKKWVVSLRIVQDVTVLCHFPSKCKLRASYVDKEQEHVDW